MTGLWWTLVRAWWKPALIIAAVVAIVLYIRHDAQQSERQKQAIRERQAYERTMEAINDAIEDVRGFGVDDAREWLRNYAK